MKIITKALKKIKIIYRQAQAQRKNKNKILQVSFNIIENNLIKLFY